MGSHLAPLVVVVSLLGVACGGDGGGTATAPSPSAGEVVSELARVEPSPDAPVAGVVRGVDDFAFEFQRLVASESENLVFSPASIATAFAMAHPGASEQTQATLRRRSGFPDEPEVHEAMNALLCALAAAEGDGVTLAVANSGWAQTGRPIGQPYLDTLATQYGAAHPGPAGRFRGQPGGD